MTQEQDYKELISWIKTIAEIKQSQLYVFNEISADLKNMISELKAMRACL